MMRASSLLAVLALVGGCEVTGLSRLSFLLRAGGLDRPAAGPLSWVTRAGWDVRLEEARVAVGPFYFNVAPPLQGLARSAGPAQVLARLLLPAAHADAGQEHTAGGRIVAQVTHRIVLDVLSPTLVTVGRGDGISELVRTAELWLLPDDRAGISGVLPRRSVAYVLGEASRAGEVVAFAAYVVLQESAVPGQPLERLRTVRRIPAELPLSDGGTVELRVDPRPWLDQADFSDLLGYPVEDGRRVARPEDSVGRALSHGVRLAQGVYEFRWRPPGDAGEPPPN
ncbi:MAG: hypothetical protein RMK29_17320 [Myxococcales bacterium]|nr:hypothetical protein [Myxococcota bacterium]MDW8283471.1 hypothetical protein [Myxococcales bacterium]